MFLKYLVEKMSTNLIFGLQLRQTILLLEI